MAGPQPTLDRQRAPAEPHGPAVEPEPPVKDVEPANSLVAGMIGSGLEWLFDLFLPDDDLFGPSGFGLPGFGPFGWSGLPRLGRPESGIPGTDQTSTEPAGPVASRSSESPPAIAPPTESADEGAVKLTTEPPPQAEKGVAVAAATPAAATRPPPPGGSTTTVGGAGIPNSGDQVNSRVDALTDALPHPTGPQAARVRQPLDETGRAITARGRSRTKALLAAPRRLVGQIPGHRPPHRPDPGPIPLQMQAVKKLMGQELKATVLPAVTASPRGTLPDFSQPVLTSIEIKAVLLGEDAILMFTRGSDPRSLEEREKLRDVRLSLGQQTTTTPPPPATSAVLPALLPADQPPPPPTSAPVVDEPLPEVKLSKGQRELFAGVVSELRIDPTAQARQVLGEVRSQHARFPGGALAVAFKAPPIEGGLLPEVTQTLATEVDSLAAALALTPGELDAAMQDRRSKVQELRDTAARAGNVATLQAQQTAVAEEGHAQQAARATAWSAHQAIAADRTVRRHPNRTRARVERALEELREPIATELARLDEQLRLRERAIADAVTVQVSAIKLAQTKDEIALTPADRSTETREDRLARAAVLHWAEKAVDDLTKGDTSAQATLVRAAKTQTEAYKADLQAAATTALAALQVWGAEHVSKTDAWWIELDGRLQGWATDATARATLWVTQQGHATRIALLQDLESLDRLSDLGKTGTKAEVDAYFDRLNAETRSVVMGFSGNAEAGATDLAGAMAAGVRHRVLTRHQGAWEGVLFNAVLALPDTDANYAGLLDLLKQVQPGVNVADLVGKIHTSVTRWRGFDEEAIFEALGGLTPLAAKVLPLAYQRKWGQSLDDALHGYGHMGHLSADELKTAAQLLAGNRVEGAVGAIHSAISGPGAEMDAVNRILRDLTPEERTQAVAVYQQRYGVTLEAELKGQWSVSQSKVTEAMQNAGSDLAAASATALQRSVYTVQSGGRGYGAGAGDPQGRRAVIDRDAAAKVYAQIRQEVIAEGKRRPWVSAQIEAEITFRSAALGAKFDEQAVGQWWAKSQPAGVTPLQAAFALDRPAGRDLLQGLAENDLAKIDVARIQLEDQGVYADDAALNAVFREQASRSVEEVHRDYGSFLSVATEKQLQSEEPFPDEEMRTDRRMELERGNTAELQKMADARTETRMTQLDTAYQLKSGRSLEAMVKDNMSFTAKKEGLARVRQGGVLTNYQKLRFSIEGVGTDVPMLTATLGSMTKEELYKADQEWREHHDGESLIEAVEGDTSGREQGDLVFMATYGIPKTAGELVFAAREKAKRDQGGMTGFGRWLTSSESDLVTAELTNLEAAYAEMRRPGASRTDQQRAGLAFEIAVEHTNTAIELQRQALDSVTDALATIAAIAVGVLLAPFTGGMSLVAAAAVTSVVATVAAIAIKLAVKGSGYSAGELGTDLAVGVVDVIVSVLTAGLGRALLGRTAGRLATADRSLLSQALSRMGSAGRAAARSEGRIAAAAARSAAPGLLVRKLGNIGLLHSLDNSKIWAVRQIGRGGALVIENAVQAVPTSLTGALLDESVYRQPGGVSAVVNNTVAGAVHSTLTSLGLAATMHVGKAGFAGARTLFSGAMPGGGSPLPRPTGGDILGRSGTPRERMAEFGQWRQRNPQGSLADFNAERLRRLGHELRVADAERQRIREARTELLAGLPANERGRYANLPIRSVGDAEFARLTGHAPRGAHLLIEHGRATIVVHEGAGPGAVAALRPAVQEKVFPYGYGLTMEALPPALRTTPIRFDSTLPRREIRVIPTPATGPITGVEVRVGPGAHPVDVALHAREVTRVRRWMDRLGDARLALARFGRRLRLDPVTPQDRTRFEAAGEIGKLGPIIDAHIRRGMGIRDPAAADRAAARIVRLVAQQQRARRILTGELVAEPRGYVAQEGDPAPPSRGKKGDVSTTPVVKVTKPSVEPAPPAPGPADLSKAVAAWTRLRDQLPDLAKDRKTAHVEGKALDASVKKLLDELSAHREVFGAFFPQQADLKKIDLTTPAGLAELREAIRGILKGKTQASRIWPPAYDLHRRLGKYEVALAGQPKEKARLTEKLTKAKQAYAQATTEAKLWLQQIVQFTQGNVTPGTAPVMHVSDRLPKRRAGEGYLPKLIASESLAKRLAHLMGWHAEGSMANKIADNLPQVVVEFGGKIGPHGADAISVVTETGWPVLWDSKYRSSGERHVSSDTFTLDGPRGNARDQAIAAVARNPDGRLSSDLVSTARQHLIKGNYTTYTVTTGDGSTFHTCVEIEVRNNKVVSTRHVKVPFGSGK